MNEEYYLTEEEIKQLEQDNKDNEVGYDWWTRWRIKAEIHRQNNHS